MSESIAEEYKQREQQRLQLRLCRWCNEYVEHDDQRVPEGIRPMHYACSVRSIIGSVGHQMKRCSCYGGTEEDPPHLSRREAAIAAVELFYLQGGSDCPPQ